MMLQAFLHARCAESGGPWSPVVPAVAAIHVQDGDGDCLCCCETWPCMTLRWLAYPFADHPEFDPEWALG